MQNLANEHPPPPDSTDLEGWRHAVKEGRHDQYRLEVIVAAIQDLGPCADKSVLNPLAKHLSDALLGILRRLVGKNHANEGVDIIERTYDKVIDALLQPNSADGKAYREAFVPRVKFRLKDVLAENARSARNQDMHERALVGGRNTRRGKTETVEKLLSPHELAQVLDESLDVATILDEITDDQKRLAFRLFMDGVPFKSKKSASIEKALGISEKTARAWVKEVQNFLSSVPAVKDLLKP